MERPPPPGISTIGENNQRAAIKEDAKPAAAAEKPARGQTRPRRPTEDVLLNPNSGKKTAYTLPTGTKGIESDVIELPMPKQRLPAASVATFKSVDGNVYSFRTRDTKGKSLPYRNEMCLFVALTEVAKGGSPVPVFDAFKLSIDDASGKKYYPIPEDILALVRAMPKENQAEGDHEDDPSDFRLGD